MKMTYLVGSSYIFCSVKLSNASPKAFRIFEFYWYQNSISYITAQQRFKFYNRKITVFYIEILSRKMNLWSFFKSGPRHKL